MDQFATPQRQMTASYFSASQSQGMSSNNSHYASFPFSGMPNRSSQNFYDYRPESNSFIQLRQVNYPIPDPGAAKKEEKRLAIKDIHMNMTDVYPNINKTRTKSN